MAQAAREVDAGETPRISRTALIEENMWRAIRHGLDGSCSTSSLPPIEEFPAAETLDRLRAWTGSDRSCPSSTAPSASAA